MGVTTLVVVRTMLIVLSVQIVTQVRVVLVRVGVGAVTVLFTTVAPWHTVQGVGVMVLVLVTRSISVHVGVGRIEVVVVEKVYVVSVTVMVASSGLRSTRANLLATALSRIPRGWCCCFARLTGEPLGLNLPMYFWSCLGGYGGGVQVAVLIMTVEVEVVQIRSVLVQVIVFVEYTVTRSGVVVVSLKYVWHGIVVVLGGRVVESVSVIVDVTVVAFGVMV